MLIIEKVHPDQTLGNTGGNNNKDAMFDWRSGCQSEDKCNQLLYSYDLCHDYYMFLHKQRILSAVVFLFFSITFVAFVCILYQVIFACCAEMFVWL